MSTKSKLEAKKSTKYRRTILQKKMSAKGPNLQNTGGHLINLQKNLGNQVCQSLYPQGAFQSKLKINRPGDKYEKDADQVADLIVGTGFDKNNENPVNPGVIQRKCASCASGGGTCADCAEDEELQRKEKSNKSSKIEHSSQLFNRGVSLGKEERHYYESRFGHNFGEVKIHNDSTANKSAEMLNARAFAVGNDIAFGKGEYNPNTIEGKKLVAHELTHVIQQKGIKDTVQRDIAEKDLPTTPVEKIMKDENYFERAIESIEFYSSEVAILNYKDGTSIRLGLVPGEIEAPFVAVDYRTVRSDHIPISPKPHTLGTGKIDFIPQGRNLELPPGATAADMPDILKAVGRTVKFTHHKGSGKLIPTEVNSISAPKLCQSLREAEEAYIRRFNDMSEGAIEILEKLDLIIILATLGEALLARSLAKGAASASGKILARAESRLVKFFGKLLKNGKTSSIIVEGVKFSSVRVALKDGVYTVTRFSIENVSRVAGRGRLVHAAFEKAAIQAATKAGAGSARVSLQTVVNPTWRAYLESMGYAKQLIKEGTNYTSYWIRTIKL